MIDDTKCVTCGASSEVVRLDKCPVCYSYYCGDCAFRSTGGRKLCSARCADIIMLGDEDDSENEFGPEE
jgi:hypothetical protein